MDLDGSQILLGSFIIIAIILIKAFFTACETSITEVNDTKIKQMLTSNRRYKQLSELTNKPSKLITTFTLNRVLSTVIISLLAVAVYILPLNNAITPSHINGGHFEIFFMILSLFIIVVLTVVIISVFAESIPKKFALKTGDDFALKVVPYVKFLVGILTPLRVTVSAISSFVLNIFGISSSSQKEVVTEEEIMMMVDAGNENGVIEETQREMISNIFEFGDLEVSDVMTHRTDIIAAEIDTKISDMVYMSINCGRSRIPIYEKDIDSIVGIVNVKDLLCLIGCENTDDISLRDFLRDVLYVPERSRLYEAFKKLSEIKGQMAVAVDEYGGTAGIVTMEDMLEAIVGNIQDEYDNDTEEILKISDGVYTIDGMAEPEHILQKLGIILPENHSYETMGGFIVDLLGKIPYEGETPSVIYEGVTFTVLVVEDKRIIRIKAFLPQKTEENSD